jgi:uncharacterized protein
MPSWAGWLSACVVLGACAATPDGPAPAPLPAPEPAKSNPNSIGSRMGASWHHVPAPVSNQQFEQDKGRCQAMSLMAPPDEGSLWLKQFLVFENCMKGAGYVHDATGATTVLAGDARHTSDSYKEAVDASLRGDYDAAIRLMSPLAAKGEAPAQSVLGSVYYLNKNYSEAAKWYRRAADQGFAEAQNSLGEMYQAGRGVPKSSLQAYLWFSLAATNPLVLNSTRDGATHKRDVIAAKMTTEQLAQARQLAGEWKPKPER